jgi:hypothetical protein
MAKNSRSGLRTGPVERRQAVAAEAVRVRQADIGLPPLQRVKRAPGEVNPRKGKSGGLNRKGKMIERPGDKRKK